MGIAGTRYAPPPAEELDTVFEEMQKTILTMPDSREQAYRIHLDYARNQFFYDGNKRTGLLVCCGHPMNNGYPPVSVPARRLNKYNASIIRFYEDGNYAEMMDFFRQCHQSMYAHFE